MSKYTDGIEPVTEDVTFGKSGKTGKQRGKYFEFGLNTVLTLVSVGLLWYLWASPLVCSVEGGGCTLIGLFGEGLRLLIPVLIARLLVDLPLSLLRLPIFRLAQRTIWQAWYKLALAMFDSFFPVWMLILGPGRFVNMSYMEVLGLSDGFRTGLTVILYVVLVAGLIISILQIFRRFRQILSGNSKIEYGN